MIRIARDHLPARLSGPWTQEKLTYVERYAHAFMMAMDRKRGPRSWSELVYLDFLAGPGRNIDRETRLEYPGSPLRALAVTPPFDRLFFSDLSRRNVDALKQRIPHRDESRVWLRRGDCHEVAAEVMQILTNRSLGVAFVDPEGLEVSFSLFETLSARRVDVIYLFPGGGIKRVIPLFAKRVDSPLDDLIRGWRQSRRARMVAGGALSRDELVSRDQPFVLAFRNQMARLGYLYSDQAEPFFTNEKNSPMYHLLFFSQHSAGLAIWRGVTRVEASGQRQFRF